MCLTNFDNVNTTHCFSCKQRIGIFFLGPFPVRFVFRDSLRTCSVAVR